MERKTNQGPTRLQDLRLCSDERAAFRTLGGKVPNWKSEMGRWQAQSALDGREQGTQGKGQADLKGFWQSQNSRAKKRKIPARRKRAGGQ